MPSNKIDDAGAYLPSPGEIAQRAAEVRAGWTDSEGVLFGQAEVRNDYARLERPLRTLGQVPWYECPRCGNRICYFPCVICRARRVELGSKGIHHDDAQSYGR